MCYFLPNYINGTSYCPILNDKQVSIKKKKNAHMTRVDKNKKKSQTR